MEKSHLGPYFKAVATAAPNASAFLRANAKNVVGLTLNSWRLNPTFQSLLNLPVQSVSNLRRDTISYQRLSPLVWRCCDVPHCLSDCARNAICHFCHGQRFWASHV
jgi:hypothetical protein